MDELITALEGCDRPLFVTHRQADRDTLGSAIGLRELLGRGAVCTPAGIGARAKPLLEALETTTVSPDRSQAFERLVVVDAPSSERIEPITPRDLVLVDHHRRDDLADVAEAALVDTDASSTAELVCRLAAAAGWSHTPASSLALVTGLLDDSGFLRTGTPETVATAGRLLTALGDRASQLPKLLDVQPAAGVENARALGMLRATGYRAGDVIVGVTRIGGHEAAAASVLRDNGVSLAVALNERGDRVRVTVRASDALARRISVAESLLPAVTTEFGGAGGGHDGAGTATVTGSAASVESFIIGWLESQLGMTFATTGVERATNAE